VKAHNYAIGSQLAIILVRVLLILIFCCNTQIELSQYLKGRVYENNTGIALDSVKIKVSATAESIYTDKNGDFKIRAKVNDLLIISGLGYQTDTLLVTNARFQEIYLTHEEHLLKEVKVNANNVAAAGSFRSYDPDFHNQTVAKQFDDQGNYKGGVIFRIWYWKKDEKKKAKNEQTLKADAAYQTIHAIFCRDTLLKYLPLKKEEVDGFIARYSPGIEEFMSPGFNMAFYLNKCYKEYKELPLEDCVKSPVF
jgi:hypothetical protein